MSTNQDPRMLELEQRHSREIAEMYEKFLDTHPELDGHLDKDDWSPQQNAAYRLFLGPVITRQNEERRQLVRDLGGKLSALSLYELAHTGRSTT